MVKNFIYTFQIHSKIYLKFNRAQFFPLQKKSRKENCFAIFWSIFRQYLVGPLNSEMFLENFSGLAL